MPSHTAPGTASSAPAAARRTAPGQGQHPPAEDGPRRVAPVPAECLVSAVPRQGHGDVAAGLPAHEEGGQLGRVGEGLVVVTTEVGHEVQGIVRRQVDPGVGGAEMPGHRLRVVRLVEPLAGEAHREGAHRSRGRGLGQRGDQGGVDAAGQEGADGDIGDQAAGHGLGQHRLELVEGAPVIVRRAVGPPWRSGPRRESPTRPRARASRAGLGAG